MCGVSIAFSDTEVHKPRRLALLDNASRAVARHALAAVQAFRTIGGRVELLMCSEKQTTSTERNICR